MPSNYFKTVSFGLIASVIASTIFVYIVSLQSNDFSQLDHYQVLNVQPGASALDIRKAYRELSLIYHPDKLPNAEFATRRFHRIAEAYEMLIDGESRRAYDLQLFGMDKAPLRLVPMLKKVGISWPSGQSLSLLDWYLTNYLVERVNRCREFLTFRTVLAAFVLLGSIVFLLESAVRCCRKVYDWFRFTGQDGIRSGSGGLLVRDEALLAARLRQQQSLLEASKEIQEREKKRRNDIIENRIIRKNLYAKKREELLRRHRDARYRQEQDYQRAST